MFVSVSEPSPVVSPVRPTLDTAWQPEDYSSPALFQEGVFSPTTVNLTHKLSRANMHNLSFMVSGQCGCGAALNALIFPCPPAFGLPLCTFVGGQLLGGAAVCGCCVALPAVSTLDSFPQLLEADSVPASASLFGCAVL